MSDIEERRFLTTMILNSVIVLSVSIPNTHTFMRFTLPISVQSHGEPQICRVVFSSKPNIQIFPQKIGGAIIQKRKQKSMKKQYHGEYILFIRGIKYVGDEWLECYFCNIEELLLRFTESLSGILFLDSFLSEPFIRLSAELHCIGCMEEEILYPFLEKDRILTPLHIYNRSFFMSLIQKKANPDSCLFRIWEMRDTISVCSLQKGEDIVLHVLSYESDLRESSTIFCNMEYFMGYIGMKCLSVRITELPHISDKQDCLKIMYELPEKCYTSRKRSISSIVWPIDDNRIPDSRQEFSATISYIERRENSRNIFCRNAEDLRDTEERKNIEYLKWAREGKTHRDILFLDMEGKICMIGQLSYTTRVDRWECSESIVQCVSSYTIAHIFVYDGIRTSFYEEEFLSEIFIKRSKVFYMIRCYFRQDSYIWYSDGKEKIHFSGMIDTIFEYEKSWIGSEKTRKCNTENGDPFEWIVPWRFRSKYGKRETELAIIVIFWEHDFIFSILFL